MRRARSATTEIVFRRIDTPEAAEALLGVEAAPVSPLRISIPDASLLRHLALPRNPGLRTMELEVRIDRFEAPVPRWRGQLGQVRHLSGYDVAFDVPVGGATVTVRTSKLTSIAEIANALIPVFMPNTPFAGAGFPLVALAAGAGDDALALLPTRSVPPVEAMVGRLQGVGLKRADVLIGGPARLADELATHHISTADALYGSPRTELPTLDLNVHNPIGRELLFKESKPARRLVVLGNQARIVRVEGSGDPIQFDVRRPLTAGVVRSLRGVESISLAGLPELPEGLPARFAEIAATDTILHSLPESIEIAPEALSPELISVIRRPYTQTMGLDRELRQVEARRIAMREHAGYFRLASAITEKTGERYLPSVSVILSTMRSELIPGVLQMMAKQTYAHFEIIVVAHGVPAPALDGVDLEGLDYTIVEVPNTVLFGAALAEGVRRSSGDLITKLDDDDWYSEHHISDLVLAHLYSRADVVGKTTEYLYFEEVGQTVHRTFATERFHDQLAGGAMLLSRATFDALGGWRPTPNSTDRSVLIRVETQGGIGYRVQSLGYMYIRHASKHTWERTASQLVQGAFEQWRGWRHPEVGY